MPQFAPLARINGSQSVILKEKKYLQNVMQEDFCVSCLQEAIY